MQIYYLYLSALEIFLLMRYINWRFTYRYLLTYLLTYIHTYPFTVLLTFAIPRCHTIRRRKVVPIPPVYRPIPLCNPMSAAKIHIGSGEDCSVETDVYIAAADDGEFYFLLCLLLVRTLHCNIPVEMGWPKHLKLKLLPDRDTCYRPICFTVSHKNTPKLFW